MEEQAKGSSEERRFKSNCSEPQGTAQDHRRMRREDQETQRPDKRQGLGHESQERQRRGGSRNKQDQLYGSKNHHLLVQAH